MEGMALLRSIRASSVILIPLSCSAGAELLHGVEGFPCLDTSRTDSDRIAEQEEDAKAHSTGVASRPPGAE